MHISQEHDQSNLLMVFNLREKMQVAANKWQYSELGRYSLAFSIIKIILYSPLLLPPSKDCTCRAITQLRKIEKDHQKGSQGGKIITTSSICCKNRKNMMMGTQSHFSQVLLWLERRVKTFPKNGIKRTKQACNALVSTCCFCCDMYMLHTHINILGPEDTGAKRDFKLSFPKVFQGI